MTATPAPRAIRERIEAICATIPGIVTVLTGAEHEITAALLPAIRVLPGRMTRRVAVDPKQSLVTRSYRILVYVAALNALRPDDDELADVEAAEDWLDVLPTFFSTRTPLLYLSTATPAIIPVGLTDVGVAQRGEEPAWLLYRKQTYTGAYVDLPVTYLA